MNEEEEEYRMYTMVQNSLRSQHRIIHFPTSLGVSEQASKQMIAAERAKKASRMA